MPEIITTNLGRVQPIYKGQYNALTTYSKLDHVLSNGSTYISLRDENQGHMGDPLWWQLVAAKGNTGETGSTGPAAGFGTPSISVVTLGPSAAPSASIVASGPSTAKVFNFDFGIPVGVDYATASASSIEFGTEAFATVSLASDSSGKGLTFNFGIPKGAAGSGSVDSVDGIDPAYDSALDRANVSLGAISYTREQTLTQTQTERARNNIQAVNNPVSKTYGDFLQYAGEPSNPTWVATPIRPVPDNTNITDYVLRAQTQNQYGWTPVFEIPSGGSANSVLAKLSDNSYDYGWSSAISSDFIDTLLS